MLHRRGKRRRVLHLRCNIELGEYVYRPKAPTGACLFIAALLISSNIGLMGQNC